MTEKEYQAVYEALEAAHEILPGPKSRDAKDSELRKKIRKLEKAVRKRQEKVARAEARINRSGARSALQNPAENTGERVKLAESPAGERCVISTF